MTQWRLRPTAAGVGYWLMLLVLMLIAVNYSNNLVFTLCFLLISTQIISVWLAVRNLRGISASQARAFPVHVGQDLKYLIAVNEKSNLHHLYLQLGRHRQFYHLRSGHPQEWVYHHPATQRGVQSEQMLRVSTLWPLGLFRVSRPLITLPETLIYPQAIEVAAAPQVLSGLAAHAHEEAEELAGLRQYQPGDNLRRVDWRSMAKGQPLQVKQFDGADGDPSTWLRWDDTAGMPYEDRIKALCHWVLECQNKGQEFGLRLPGIEVSPQRDGVHASECLKQLALMPGEQG